MNRWGVKRQSRGTLSHKENEEEILRERMVLLKPVDTIIPGGGIHSVHHRKEDRVILMRVFVLIDADGKDYTLAV